MNTPARSAPLAISTSSAVHEPERPRVWQRARRSRHERSAGRRNRNARKKAARQGHDLAAFVGGRRDADRLVVEPGAATTSRVIHARAERRPDGHPDAADDRRAVLEQARSRCRTAAIPRRSSSCRRSGSSTHT